MSVTLTCLQCGKPFEVRESYVSKRKCCSDPCGRLYSQRFQISPNLLLLEVWDRPVTAIAADMGVSDKAIEKRCIKHGVTKPPRGYWRNIEVGFTHEEALSRLGWTESQIEDLNTKIAEANNLA